MVDTPELVAQVQSVTTDPGGTEVQVEVIGPSLTPNFTRSLRARARALMVAGAVPTTVDTVEDMTMGKVERFTRERKDPVREGRGMITDATLHTIIVNRD